MCRHLAVLGAPQPLDTVLWRAPHALVHQSHAPAHQDLGRINADGWGVGWWDLDVRAEPARYRTATPMWADRRFAEVAPVVRTGALVAAVRNASPGAPVEETGNAPFAAGPWLFSLNGYVDGFREGLGVALRREVSTRRDAGILGASDSEVLFALLLDRLDAGDEPGAALGGLVTRLAAEAGGRLNLLLGDGTRLWATRFGNSLFTHRRDGTTTVASEPLDPDDAAWVEVPPASIVTVTADEVAVAPL